VSRASVTMVLTLVVGALALTYRPVVPRSRASSSARMLASNARDEMFVQRALQQCASQARYEVERQEQELLEVKAFGGCLNMPTWLVATIITYVLALSLTAMLVMAEGSAHLINAPPPVVSLMDARLAAQGALVGVPGALLVSKLERWRSAACVEADNSAQLLQAAVQLGMLPVSCLFPGFGARALPMVEVTPFISAAALVGGAVSSSAWMYGVIQVGYGSCLRDAALLLQDVATESPASVSTPMVALCHFASEMAPVSAVMVAAAAATTAECLCASLLQPTAMRRRAGAEDAAIASMRRRAPAVWALEAPADVASRRVALLDAAVSRRSRRQTDARKRQQYATFGRAAVAAAAFAASGGSLIAPVATSLGVLYAPPFQSRYRAN